MIDNIETTFLVTVTQIVVHPSVDPLQDFMYKTPR